MAITLACSVSQVYAQSLKEGNIWYFEGGMGVDFNFTPPKPISDGRVFWQGKSSTICDVNGNLLFYSSGDSVWNKNHQPMLNGFGINGASFPIFTTSVIVPHPGDGQLYYIIKTNLEHGGHQPTGLHYSVVDISEDNGMGAVIYKKKNFIPITSPFLTVTLHADEKSYWVITHGFSDNKFYAINITESGVSEPVTSTIGNIFGDVIKYNYAQIKVSPDGTKIALVNSVGYQDGEIVGGFVHLYDFNAKTGTLSNFRELNIWSTGGVEFSPNSELLYVSGISKIPFQHFRGVLQLDISSGIVEEINNSVAQIGFVFNEIGELQLGPDGKIYGGDQSGGQTNDYPCIINEPNVKGDNCNFVNNGLLLSGIGSPFHLPLSVQSIYRESPAIPESSGCRNLQTQLRVTSLGYADSLVWDFGDGSTEGRFPLSSGKIVSHTYTQTGEYTVKVKKFIDNVSREILSKTTIIERPVVYLGKDTILCKGEELMLDAGADSKNFKWSTGQLTRQIIVMDENQYEVFVDNGVCTTSDSIQVQVYDYPEVELGEDKIICDSGSTTLATSFNLDFLYEWNSGATTPEIMIQESGLYEVTVSKGRCTTKDQIDVQFGQINFNLSETELEVPFDTVMYLEAIGTNMEKWSWNFGDGLSEQTFSPFVNHRYLKAGEYSGIVNVTNKYECSASTSFHVTVPEYLFIPNVVTANNDTKNELFEIQYNGSEQSTLMIFDRWGKKVFFNQSYDNKWPTDDVDSGTYYYQLKLGKEIYKGWISVIK